MFIDQRQSERVSSCNAVFFRADPASDYRMGSLIEYSDTGFAFAIRGGCTVWDGTMIQAHLDAPSLSSPPRSAHVVRVTPVHSDLVVVACQWIEKRAGPPADPAASSGTPEQETATEHPLQPIMRQPSIKASHSAELRLPNDP